MAVSTHNIGPLGNIEQAKRGITPQLTAIINYTFRQQSILMNLQYQNPSGYYVKPCQINSPQKMAGEAGDIERIVDAAGRRPGEKQAA